jgi:hypothetical protein
VGGQGGAHFSYYETKTFSLYHEFFHDLILSRLVCIRQVDEESNIFGDFIGVGPIQLQKLMLQLLRQLLLVLYVG